MASTCPGTWPITITITIVITTATSTTETIITEITMVELEEMVVEAKLAIAMRMESRGTYAANAGTIFRTPMSLAYIFAMQTSLIINSSHLPVGNGNFLVKRSRVD